MYSFSHKEKWALYGLLALLLPALLVNLGIVPLYVEEPRRATVALEMLFRGNWLVPAINGGPYYLKPPVFNWIIALVYKITGSNSEFLTRLPTVVSLLLLGWIIFRAGKKYVSTSFGALSSLLFVTASGNLFFNSLLAEIDIFYSMVTYLGLVCLFHFHQQKKYLLLFITVYFLGAVGTLTKGLPSLLFIGLSLLAFFIANKNFRKLFSFAHLAGIVLYVLIIGGYFLAYSRQGDVVKYLLSLTIESGKRFSGNSILVYLQHMVLYPLDTLANLLPASLLVLFVFRKSFMKNIRENAFMKFALLMLIVNFPVYWLPPGGKQRYIIMLYPFIIQIFTYFYLIYLKKESRKSGIITFITAVVLVLGAAGSLVPLFIGRMQFISHLTLVCIVASLIMTGLFIFHLKKPGYTIISLLYGVLVLRIFFGLVVLPVRATEGKAPANRQVALSIAEAAKDRPLCILQPTYIPMQTIFYLERRRGGIVPVFSEAEPGKIAIVDNYLLNPYQVFRETSSTEINPLHPFSDMFNWDDHQVLSGYSYRIIKEIELQKRKYSLLVPIRQRP